MNNNCYYDYSTGHKILIPGCYGSLHNKPDNCTCQNGIFDPMDIVKEHFPEAYKQHIALYTLPRPKTSKKPKNIGRGL